MSSKAARKRRQAKRANLATALAEREAPRVDESPHSTMRAIAPKIDSPEEAAVRVIGAVLEGIAAPLGASAETARADDEHRAHRRVSLEVEIDLHGESCFFTGLSGDVSEGGVFVQTYRPLVVGDPVDVAFDLPDGRVETHGTVRWKRARSEQSEPGFGVSFDGLSERDRGIIRKFCEMRAPLYYEV